MKALTIRKLQKDSHRTAINKTWHDPMKTKPIDVLILLTLVGFVALITDTLWRIRQKAIADAERMPQIAMDMRRIADTIGTKNIR